ncbi:GNAT family N-acetyltransferase [Anaerosporobacter faecicola]|uniref:GNAT family N-acetyltransferase n=1 Tax=Anaerosporobacter faecicola TaxID=2718714 RepID=UPI00143B72C7|nr:GNAT family N-acetyltransferase [Anaerosporobacter faecicola]
MNNEIVLKKFREEDIALFKQWLYKPHVARWYEQPLSWLEEIDKRDTEYRWIQHYIVWEQGRPMGFCQYYEYVRSGEDWNGSIPVQGTYSMDYMIGEEEFLHRGYGKQIVYALIEQIGNHNNAKRIIVQPEKENLASCGVLQASGFRYDDENELYIMNLDE